MRTTFTAALLAISAAAFAQDGATLDGATMGTARGVVVDAAGRPVSGAVIRVISADGRSSHGPASEDGSFRVSGKSVGPARLLVLSPGARPTVSDWFELRREATTDAGRLVVRPGWTVQGAVVGADGERVSTRLDIEPIDDVNPETWAWLRDQGLFDKLETSTESGFEIRWLPPGTYRLGVLRASSRDTTPCRTQTVVVPASGSGAIPITIELPRALTPRNMTIEVRAEDPDGRAIESFDGSLENGEFGYSFSSENGAATVTSWGTPPLLLRVHGGDRFLPAELEVTSREEPYVVRLERPDRSLDVAGVVTFDGEPVSWSRSRHCWGTDTGAKLALTATPVDGGATGPLLVWLRSDGRFAFNLPRAGPWRLRVSGDREWQPSDAEAPLPAEVVVHAGARDIEIPLSRGVPLEAYFELPGGARADAYAARLIDESGATSARRCSTFTAEGSLVVFPRVRPDSTYTLVAAARRDGRWTETVRVGGLKAGGLPLPVALPPGRSVEVRVVRADGTPVVGARVRRVDGLPETVAYTRAGGPSLRRGSAWLTLPRTASAAVVAESPGLAPAGAPVVVSPDQREVTIELRPLPPVMNHRGTEAPR